MSEAKFICECLEDFRTACKGLDFYREVEGEKFCVLHCPIKDKEQGFNVALRRKLASSDFDFQGVYFPVGISFSGVNFPVDVDFGDAIFSAAADFAGAKFSAGAQFRRAKFSDLTSFREATFDKGAYFGSAKFGNLSFFERATFKGGTSFIAATFSAHTYFNTTKFGDVVDFTGVTCTGCIDFFGAIFSGDAHFDLSTFGTKLTDRVSFSHATFSGKADFANTTFSAAVDFSGAKCESYLRFVGSVKKPVFTEMASLNLQDVRIAKPEQVIFHSIKLRPHWFMDVDSRKFEFTNIDWGKTTVRDELQALENIENRHYLLSIAYRRLATNAEDNNQYVEAAKFRYAAMDARRLEYKWGRATWWFDCCYWALSGYGERIGQAFFALLLVLIFFSVPYRFVGFAPTKFLDQDKVGTPIHSASKYENRVRQFIADTATACIYSLETASLQKPEPRPATFWARFFVGLETILAPLQAALLALAVRRRFMR